jgi:predicted kinase
MLLECGCMATAFHLICGSTGAGKTTYALGLAERLNGIQFSIDEWMVRLFGKDQPQTIQFNWVMDRVERCEQQIGRVATQCARAGVTPVLDLSFLRARDRANFAKIAEQAGCSVKLHVLDLPATERWERVKLRNEARGETFSLTISKPIFDFFEKIWERPTPAEMTAYNAEYVSR